MMIMMRIQGPDDDDQYDENDIDQAGHEDFEADDEDEDAI